MTYCLVYGWKNQSGEKHTANGKILCGVYFYESPLEVINLIAKGEAEGEWHSEGIFVANASEEQVATIKEEIDFDSQKAYYSYGDIVDVLQKNTSAVTEELKNTISLTNQINKTHNELVIGRKWIVETVEETKTLSEGYKKEFLNEDKQLTEQQLIKAIKENESILERLEKSLVNIEPRLKHVYMMKEVMSNRQSARKVLNHISTRNQLWEFFGKKEAMTKLRKVSDCVYL